MGLVAGMSGAAGSAWVSGVADSIHINLIMLLLLFFVLFSNFPVFLFAYFPFS
jgi:hypothetical protein